MFGSEKRRNEEFAKAFDERREGREAIKELQKKLVEDMKMTHLEEVSQRISKLWSWRIGGIMDATGTHEL